MDIVVIDRDELVPQLITSKLAAKGHKVISFAGKKEALELLALKKVDCVMVDPSPLSEARPVIIGIWKAIRGSYTPYMMLLSKTATQADAIAAGTNDVLNKPLNARDLETKIGNAERLIELCQRLGQGADIKSEGGAIGRAAFNQLFLSAIDRSFRYGERSLVVFVSLDNYQGMVAAKGQEAADDTMKKLTGKLVFMRRQSDVIGHIGEHEFAILLQRPQYETEPLDAMGRFSEVLDKFYNGFEDKAMAPRLTLSLIELPLGALHMEKHVPIVQSSPDIGIDDAQHS